MMTMVMMMMMMIARIIKLASVPNDFRNAATRRIDDDKGQKCKKYNFNGRDAIILPVKANGRVETVQVELCMA